MATFPIPLDVFRRYGYSSLFGPRVDPILGRGRGFHAGVDMPGPSGTPLIAVERGYVSQAWDPGGGGNWSGLTTKDGRYFGYGHALRFATGVNGTWVDEGTVIAYMGTTGGSTGVHLHFALRPTPGASYVDPKPYLDSIRVGSPTPPKPQEDWFSMASEADLEKVVRKVVQEEIVNQDARLLAVLKALDAADDAEDTKVLLQEFVNQDTRLAAFLKAAFPERFPS